VLFKSHVENNVLHFFLSCQILVEEHGTNCNFKKQLNVIESLIDQFDAFWWFQNVKKRFNTLWESSQCANRGTKLKISGRTLRFAMWFIFENG